MGKRVKHKTIIASIAFFIMLLQPAMSVNALTVYESDGIYHEEGYIVVGESHSVLAAHAVGMKPETLGEGISYVYQWDWSRESTESGGANTFTMKGNLFFVFEGNAATDASLQTSRKYIYSDGMGGRGRAVEKIHEIINMNPNIAHWNIISIHGAVSAKEGTREIADYYVRSYRNWMAYEFPQADCYFVSIATMTRYYKATSDKKVFNNTLAAAFPDRFLDYTDFYASRSPQRMIDTIHWDDDTYIDLVLDIIGKIAQKKQAVLIVPEAESIADAEYTAAQPAINVEYVTADVQAVLYTNEATVIYAQPALESAVILPSCEAGLPIQVTGITSNGFFRVCVSPDGAESFIAGGGLSQQP